MPNLSASPSAPDLSVAGRLTQFREHLQPIPTGALVEVLRLDPALVVAMLRSELASRGLDMAGAWVGFEAARALVVAP